MFDLFYCKVAHGGQGRGGFLTALRRFCLKALAALYLLSCACAAGASAEAPKAFINGIRLTTQYGGTEAEAKRVIAPFIGKEVTAATLTEVLNRLNRYYRTNGYPYATAYYPEQIADDGYFRITVMEPKVGLYELQNRSSLTTDAVNRLLGLSSQGRVNDTAYTDMHKRLLMLSDLNMTTIEGFYAQDEDYEPLKLYVNVRDRELNVVDVFADNHGTKAAGRHRAGVRGNLRNLSGNADELRFILSRTNEAQNNLNLSYEIPLNRHFTTVGAGLCWSNYDLGGDLERLDATGHSLTAELFVRQPLIRTPDFRLDADFGGRYRKSRDRLGTFDVTFKNHTLAAYAGLGGWWRPHEDWLVQAGIRGTFGTLKCDDDYRVYSDHEYSILNFDYAISYRLSPELSLSNTGQAQIASAELDSSDSFQATGPMALAAFDSSAAVGDSGFWDNLALDYKPLKDLNLTIAPHMGSGYVKNRSSTSRSLYGAGLSVAMEYEGWHVTAQLEKALGTVPAGQDSCRFLIKAGYRFA